MTIYPIPGKPVLVPVYAKDRTTVLGYVSRQTTSVGAQKVAGCPIAGFAFVNNKPAWVATL